MTKTSSDDQVTRLLHAWQEGDEQALEQVSTLVYDELRRLAHSYMRPERQGHTMQATALVNEAFVRLIHADIDYQSRKHFMVIAARMMRRILIDHARSQNSSKRGGEFQRVTMIESAEPSNPPSFDIIDLDAALTRLAVFDQRKASIIEQQYFGGLPVAEVADVLDLSKRTVEREARLARAWLQAELCA